MFSSVCAPLLAPQMSIDEEAEHELDESWEPDVPAGPPDYPPVFARHATAELPPPKLASKPTVIRPGSVRGHVAASVQRSESSSSERSTASSVTASSVKSAEKPSTKVPGLLSSIYPVFYSNHNYFNQMPVTI